MSRHIVRDHSQEQNFLECGPSNNLASTDGTDVTKIQFAPYPASNGSHLAALAGRTSKSRYRSIDTTQFRVIYTH